MGSLFSQEPDPYSRQNDYTPTQPPQSNEPVAIRCKNHGDKSASVFCHTCDEAICVTCALRYVHNGHHTEEITEAGKRCADQSREMLSKITKICTSLHQQIERAAAASDPACSRFLAQMTQYHDSIVNTNHIGAKDAGRGTTSLVSKTVSCGSVLNRNGDETIEARNTETFEGNPDSKSTFVADIPSYGPRRRNLDTAGDGRRKTIQKPGMAEDAGYDNEDLKAHEHDQKNTVSSDRPPARKPRDQKVTEAYGTTMARTPRTQRTAKPHADNPNPSRSLATAQQPTPLHKPRHNQRPTIEAPSDNQPGTIKQQPSLQKSPNHQTNEHIPPFELPLTVDPHKFRLLASALLPNYEHIDVNRLGHLLLTFRGAQCCIYEQSARFKTFQKMEDKSNVVSGKGARTMESINVSVILSQGDEIVCEDDTSIFSLSEAYTIETGKEELQKIRVLARDWMAITSKEGSGLRCDIIGCARLSKMRHTKKDLTLKSMVMSLDGYEGIAILSNYSEVHVLRVYEEDCTVISESPVKLNPPPETVKSAAVVKDWLVLLKSYTRISVYTLRGKLMDPPSNRTDELGLKHLGLAPGSQLLRIWAGDTKDGGSTLHVMFKSPAQGLALVAYAIKE